MHLVYYAKEVNYAEALGGDIIQVTFNQHADPDLGSTVVPTLLPPIKYLLFSVNYECPPCTTEVEWFDGEDDCGRESIREIVLTRSKLNLVLENSYSFEVGFQTDDITYQNISSFLPGEIR